MSASQSRDAAPILVIGATGHTGRHVVSGLTQLGRPVRAATRGAHVPDSTAEPVRFDWAEPSSYDAALAGVERMYVMAPDLVADPLVLMQPFLERAWERGVRRVVLLGASSSPEGAPGLGLVHRLLSERSPEWAVLQPSSFMQNFVNERHPHGAGLKNDGLLVTATGDGRVGFVDARDIAEVAVRALADETSHNTAHLVTGPQALRYDDIVAVITEVAGRPMRHVKATPKEARRHLTTLGIPDRSARILVRLDEAIQQGAENRVTDTVARVTRHEPRTFEAFAKEHADFWRAA
ncbi:MAG TPA: NmrA family NAD(P)-binding protein [Kofleriaceae bacterium]|nr:NmrA family NAD(P)-binding protein [Kofleriaceae bacterium]